VKLWDYVGTPKCATCDKKLGPKIGNLILFDPNFVTQVLVTLGVLFSV